MRDGEVTQGAGGGRGQAGPPPTSQRQQPFEREQMPGQQTLQRAHRDREEGKAPSTQAGEFIREEMHHVREGKHGVRSTKQAIAIGLSKARRAGVKLPPPRKGTVSEKTRRSAESAYRRGQSHARVSGKRSRATERALQREGRSAASRRSLSRHAHRAAGMRSAQQRSTAAKNAARTRKRAAHPHSHN